MDTTPTTQKAEETQKSPVKSLYPKEFTETTFRNFVAQITLPHRKRDAIVCITFACCIFIMPLLIDIAIHHNEIENVKIGLLFIIPSIILIINIYFDKKGAFLYTPVDTLQSKMGSSGLMAMPIQILYGILLYLPDQFWKKDILSGSELTCVILIIPVVFIIYFFLKRDFIFSDHKIDIHNYMYEFYIKYKKINYTNEQIIALFESMDHYFPKHPFYYIPKK